MVGLAVGALCHCLDNPGFLASNPMEMGTPSGRLRRWCSSGQLETEHLGWLDAATVMENGPFHQHIDFHIGFLGRLSDLRH